MYQAFQYTASGLPKYQTSTITVVGNQASQLAAYNAFYAKTRLGVAKAAVAAGGRREHEVRTVWLDCHAPGDTRVCQRCSTTEKCRTTISISRSRLTGAGRDCGR